MKEEDAFVVLWLIMSKKVKTIVIKKKQYYNIISKWNNTNNLFSFVDQTNIR